MFKIVVFLLLTANIKIIIVAVNNLFVYLGISFLSQLIFHQVYITSFIPTV